MHPTQYKRILLKLSGESLAGAAGCGVDADKVNYFSTQVCRLVARGLEVALVIGGGNYFRGATTDLPMQRPVADQVGMLATMMNALVLQQALLNAGQCACVLSAVSMPAVVDRFVPGSAVRLLQSGQVVILGGGTGNPYFTTDSAAALRALELNADCLIKATRVDGVYSSDPEQDPNAKRFVSLSYSTILQKNLKALDATAVVLCREQGLPVHVVNIFEVDCLARLFDGEPVGTLIGPDTMEIG